MGVFGPCAVLSQIKAESPALNSACNTQITSEDYFQTVGVPFQQGRDFTVADAAGAPSVAVVNDAFARRAFPNQNPIGQKIVTMFDGTKEPREIVGVIKDVRDRGLDAKAIPTVYIPYEQIALAYGSIAVRSALLPSTLIPEIRRRIAEIDPSVPLTNFQTIDSRIHKTLDEPRFYTVMAGACALMATLFVTLGLYGVVAYSVSRRTAEIGIRMALGARSQGILRMVLLQGLQLAAFGVAIGVALSLAASRVLASFLFQVKPSDPVVLCSAAVLVVMVTSLASYFPARRASNVDPMIAQRHQ
jgi:predicted permease